MFQVQVYAPGAALRLLQEAQDRARGHVGSSRLAWLAALEARAHAGPGDATASLADTTTPTTGRSHRDEQAG